MGFIIRLLINGLALFGIAYFHVVPGVHVSGILGAIIAAFVLGLVNAIIRPILIILSLPLEILTLGLFTFIINAFLFWGVGHLGIGLVVHGFWAALFGAILLSIVSWLLSSLVQPKKTA